MNIETRKRKYGQGKTYVKYKKKLPIVLDLSSLNLMCQYVLSENRNIKRSAYINLRNLIELLDMEKYISDQDKYRRIIFIKKAIEAKLEKGLQNPEAIVKYVNGGFIDKDIIEIVDINNFTGMSNSEIDWINETVSNTLSLTFLYEETPKLLDLLTRFMGADSGDISKIGNEIKDSIAHLNTMFRQATVQSVTNETFSLNANILRDRLGDIQDQLKSEYRKLITGMQGLNQMLGGGFENTRCYLFLGVTGVGKSLSLLNIAYQLKKYNKTFKPKDPTKIPCIVYLTMENTVEETVDRLFKMSTGEDIRNCTQDEAVRLLQSTGELYLTDESPIDIIIKYMPNRSVDTGYLYTLTEDLEDEGYEVICMIQDHVKRIRSVTNETDVRLELGHVINEMKTFAILKDIPMITVSHLNRDGARVIDSSSSRTKSDLTRLLGKSNIGESLLMLDNVDYGAIINREYDADGNCYLVFKAIKERFAVMRSYICQPFMSDNELRLVEDIYSQIPVFKESLYDTSLNQVSAKSRPTQGNIKPSTYTAIAARYTENEENIYEVKDNNAIVYSSIDIDAISDDNTIAMPNIVDMTYNVMNDNRVPLMTKIA